MSGKMDSDSEEDCVGIDFSDRKSPHQSPHQSPHPGLVPTTGCCNCSVFWKVLCGSLAASGAILLALANMPVTAGAFGICSFLLFASAYRSRPEPDSPSSTKGLPSHNSRASFSLSGYH